MQKIKGLFRNTTVSRGGVTCAHNFFLPEKKHEIKSGEPIYWVDVELKSGQKKLLGYCSWDYDELFVERPEPTPEGVADGTD